MTSVMLTASQVCVLAGRLLLTLHVGSGVEAKACPLAHSHLYIVRLFSACHVPATRLGELVFKKKRHTNGWRDWGFTGVLLRRADAIHRKSVSPVTPSAGPGRGGGVVVEACPGKAAETQQEFTGRSERSCARQRGQQGHRPRSRAGSVLRPGS